MKKSLFKTLIFSCIIFIASAKCYPDEAWIGMKYSVSLSYLNIKEKKEATTPTPKSIQMPAYPVEAAIRLFVSGHAVVTFVIKEDGSIGAIKAIEASYNTFEDAAKKAVNEWSFYPSMNKESKRPMAVHMQCRFEFDASEHARPAAIWDCETFKGTAEGGNPRLVN